jgi:predicted RNA binding protein YcfA (HicA-like mRNA interferase family)
MKVRDVLNVLDEDGWFVARTRGSHRVMKHASKPGIVVVPGHMADEVAPGTLKSIRDQAQLRGKL